MSRSNDSNRNNNSRRGTGRDAQQSNNNSTTSNTSTKGIKRMDLPLYAISGLSHIITTHEASQILGEATVRAVVRSFLRCSKTLYQKKGGTGTGTGTGTAISR